jgi:hypothetical protein
MHKLARLPESPMLVDLMVRLRDANIAAACVPDRTIFDIHLGVRTPMAVMIAERGDLDRALAILREVQGEGKHARCPNCDYDMRGHAGVQTCPECGGSVNSSFPDVPCPACGEPVPGNFDLCWNCGRAMSG